MTLRTLLLAGLSLALVAGGCGSSGTTTAPLRGWDFVLVPEKVHYGGSYADWSVLWSQWALELPATGHPLVDQVGTDVATGQVDPVWFIGGEFGSPLDASAGQAERTVTIPGNVALFFSIINGGWDNEVCVPPDWVDRTAAELAALAYETVNQAVDLYCILDGDTIIDSPNIHGNAARFRAISGTFSYSMPADNVAVTPCGFPAEPIFVPVTQSDGIWMMLAPMTPGLHELTFGGAFPTTDGGLFRLDIVYHINVSP